jgi:hypothetical protein
LNLKNYIIEQIRNHLDDLGESAGDFIYEFDIDEDDEEAFVEFEADWQTACQEVDQLLEAAIVKKR